MKPKSIPAEGWSGPDKDGLVRFVKHAALHDKPPEREGYECFFVAVHGLDFTRWTYRPVAGKEA